MQIPLTGVTDGATHWQRTHESTFNLSGLAVTDDQIVIGGRRQTEHGFLRLRSLADGEPLQTFDIANPVIAPPVLGENTIIATCQIDDQRGYYRAYNYDGDAQWTHELGGMLPAPPTLSQGTVYGGSPNGTVFALSESDGAIQWERTFGDDRQGGAVSAPVTVDETSVYVPVSSSADRGIYALSRTDGQTQWTIKGPRIQSLMVRAGDSLLVSYPSSELAAFDAQTGEQQWSETLVERQISPPAVGDEMVVISDDATLYGLDFPTGDQRWSLACSPNPNSQPVIAGDTVIVQAEDGLIGCSLADGERLWTINSGSRIPVVPVEHGLLYSPAADTLATYTSCQN